MQIQFHYQLHKISYTTTAIQNQLHYNSYTTQATQHQLHNTSYTTQATQHQLHNTSYTSPQKARCNTDVGSISQCAKGFFSKSQLSMQNFSQCSHSPHIQSQTLAATPLFGRVKTLAKIGSAALAAVVALPK